MLKKDIILQARSSSTRLPGKIFMELGGKTMLEQILIRLTKTENVRYVCVATILKDFLKISNISKKYGCKTIWGSERDVLGRFIKAAKILGSEIVVRTTADNPLVDYETLSCVLPSFDSSSCDLMVVDGLPYGAGFEIISASVLKRLGTLAKKPEEREHVTLYIYNHPDKFKIKRLTAPSDLYAPELRVTVDTEEDIKRARRYYSLYFNEKIGMVNLREVIKYEYFKSNNHIL